LRRRIPSPVSQMGSPSPTSQVRPPPPLPARQDPPPPPPPARRAAISSHGWAAVESRPGSRAAQASGRHRERRQTPFQRLRRFTASPPPLASASSCRRAAPPHRGLPRELRRGCWLGAAGRRERTLLPPPCCPCRVWVRGATHRRCGAPPLPTAAVAQAAPANAARARCRAFSLRRWPRVATTSPPWILTLSRRRLTRL